METLSASRLSIRMTTQGRAVTVDVKPIQRFEARLHNYGDQQTLWLGYLDLSNEFSRPCRTTRSRSTTERCRP